MIRTATMAIAATLFAASATSPLHAQSGGAMPSTSNSTRAREQEQAPDSTRARPSSRSSRRDRAMSQGVPGLTHDQIHQLQQALSDAGYSVGSVDGRMGPRTRQALAKARQDKGTGNNLNALFRALSLDFTVSDSLGMGGAMRRGKSYDGASRGGRGRGRDPNDTAAVHMDHMSDSGAMSGRPRGRGARPGSGSKPVRP